MSKSQDDFKKTLDAIVAKAQGTLQPGDESLWQPNNSDHLEFAQACIDRIESLPVAVSEAVFTQHTRHIDSLLKNADSNEAKIALMKLKKRHEDPDRPDQHIPMLPLATALHAFGELTIIEDPYEDEPAYVGSRRLEAINSLIEIIAEEAWKSSNMLEAYILDLEWLLHDAELDVNLTHDAATAKHLANSIVDGIYAARAAFLGRSNEQSLTDDHGTDALPLPIAHATKQFTEVAEDASTLLPAIQAFARELFDRVDCVRVPVTPEQFARHLYNTRREIEETGQNELRDLLEPVIKNGLHTLALEDACSAFNSMLLGDESDDEHPRWKEIEAAFLNLAVAVWNNNNIPNAEKRLADSLYNPNEPLNATSSDAFASEAAQQVMHIAQTLKAAQTRTKGSTTPAPFDLEKIIGPHKLVGKDEPSAAVAALADALERATIYSDRFHHTIRAIRIPVSERLFNSFAAWRDSLTDSPEGTSRAALNKANEKYRTGSHPYMLGLTEALSALTLVTNAPDTTDRLGKVRDQILTAIDTIEDTYKPFPKSIENLRNNPTLAPAPVEKSALRILDSLRDEMAELLQSPELAPYMPCAGLNAANAITDRIIAAAKECRSKLVGAERGQG
jgi:hypothetical protein